MRKSEEEKREKLANLVRDDEDESVGTLDGLDEVGLSNDVVSKVDAGEVLLVLVGLIDDFGNLAAFKLRERETVNLRFLVVCRKAKKRTYVLLEAPHLDLRVEAVTALLDVFAD